MKRTIITTLASILLLFCALSFVPQDQSVQIIKDKLAKQHAIYLCSGEAVIAGDIPYTLKSVAWHGKTYRFAYLVNGAKRIGYVKIRNKDILWWFNYKKIKTKT